MTAWHLQPADQGPDQTPTSLADSRDHHIVEIAALDTQNHVNDVATPASTSISQQRSRSRLRQLIIIGILFLAMIVDVSVLYMLANGDEYVTAALQRDLLQTVTETVTKTTTISKTPQIQGVPADVPTKKPTEAPKAQTQVPPVHTAPQPPQAPDLPSLEPKDHKCKNKPIAFITDAEGDFEWFKAAVEKTGLMYFEMGKETDLPILKFNADDPGKTACFVYGGDTVDGTNSNQEGNVGGDIRIVAALNQFRKANPEQVFFILGNRDSNKLRLLSEIEGKESSSQFASYRQPPFRKGEPGGFDFAKLGPLNEKYKDSSYQLQECPDKTGDELKVCQLKYILVSTFAAPAAFEFRKQELELLRNKEVTDKNVLDSFLTSLATAEATQDELQTSNFMFQYLQASHVALKLDKSLFIHSIPKAAALERGGSNFALALQKLNNIWQEQLTLYKNNPNTFKFVPVKEQLDNGPKPGLYSEDVRDLIPTIGDKPKGADGATEQFQSGGYRAVYDRVKTLLMQSGCHFLLMGHIPQGASPLMFDLGGGDWAIDADNGKAANGEGRLELPNGVPRVIVTGDRAVVTTAQMPGKPGQEIITLSSEPMEVSMAGIGTIQRLEGVAAGGRLGLKVGKDVWFASSAGGGAQTNKDLAFKMEYFYNNKWVSNADWGKQVTLAGQAAEKEAKHAKVEAAGAAEGKDEAAGAAERQATAGGQEVAAEGENEAAGAAEREAAAKGQEVAAEGKDEDETAGAAEREATAGGQEIAAKGEDENEAAGAAEREAVAGGQVVPPEAKR